MDPKQLANWAELDQIEADILEGIKEEGGIAALDREKAAAIAGPISLHRCLLLYAITRFTFILRDATAEEIAP